MARYGVGLKILLTLTLGYADIITDLLVAKSYYDAKEFSTAYATAGFAVLAIVIQSLCTFFSIRGKGGERGWGGVWLVCVGWDR